MQMTSQMKAEDKAMEQNRFVVRVGSQTLRYPSERHAKFAMQIHADWSKQRIEYTLIVDGKESAMVTE